MVDPLTIGAAGWGIAMAGWIISPYITRLIDEVYSHIKPGKKSRDNLHKLKTQVIPRLKLILEAADGTEHKELFEELVSGLKSAFRDTEDILDELEYNRHNNQARQRKRKSAECGPSDQIPGPLRDQLDKNIKKIQGLIDEARETLKIENATRIATGRSNLTNDSGSAKNGPNATAGKVTGRDDVRDRIMSKLEGDCNPRPGDKCFSVIGIYGLPGYGKTTLAQHISEAAETSEYFNLVMWIHVSEKFNVDIILKEMFEQAWNGNGQCPQHNSPVVLKKELKKLLKDKRFLLVLDDVWCSKDVNEQKKLPELLPPLIAANNGCKILVTSRHQDALLELGPEVRVIDNSAIPELDDEVFLELLMHNAFGQRIRDDVASYRLLLKFGSKIAQKLKKSPLLASVVGQMLYKNHDVDHWESIAEQKILDEYMGPLWWCYQHLDEQVKRCFAYCSVFPRRRHLYRDELVNLWVAEGFISTTKGGRDMQHVSKDYFSELLSISFLQPRKDNLGKDYFVIHDLLHDLSELVAGGECFKIENVWTKAPSDVRRLSIESCNASMITEDIVKLKNLRTLIIFHAKDDVSEHVLDKMFMELTKLRVLIFQTDGASLDSGSFLVPRSINYSKHLRYLGFVGTSMFNHIILPDTIVELYLLQVLDFGFQADVESSTGVDYTSLTNLRHVITGGGEMYFPNMGRLTSLKTIPTLDVSMGEGYELHQLSDLNDLRGDLDITGLEIVDSKEKALQAKLADKKRVKSLSLSWALDTMNGDAHADVLEGLCPPEGLQYLKITGYGGSRYPSWMMGPQESAMDLHELRLHKCAKLVPAPAPELYFVRVTSLVLKNCNWDAMPYNMVYLTSLELINSCYKVMPNNMDQLTSLKRLIIFYCLHFDQFPALPTSLKYLEVCDCNDEFTSSCKTIGHPNFKAIEYIPDKLIHTLSKQEFVDKLWPDFHYMGESSTFAYSSGS